MGQIEQNVQNEENYEIEQNEEIGKIDQNVQGEENYENEQNAQKEQIEYNDPINESKNQNEQIPQNEKNQNIHENSKEKINSEVNNEIEENKIDNAGEKSIKSYKINSEKDILRNANKNKNKEKYIYNNIELKYELTNTDIIRSIEFTDNNHIIVCTLENISLYKMNPDYELLKVFDIKEFNYRINYAAQLSNGNLVICSLNNIDIIQLTKKDESLSYNLIQKINGRNDSHNINKVIEIKEKNLLISCDKNI